MVTFVMYLNMPLCTKTINVEGTRFASVPLIVLNNWHASG